MDGADAAEVVEVAADLVVGGCARELRLRDEEVGLRYVGCGYVVAEEQDCHGGLGVVVLAEDG